VSFQRHALAVALTSPLQDVMAPVPAPANKFKCDGDTNMCTAGLVLIIFSIWIIVVDLTYFLAELR
jgi:hypothetical protein